METNAIHADHRNGNLHLNLHGDFTTETALRLTSTIARTYNGRGNIFIHTAQVADIAPESRHTFAEQISMLGLPQEKMYLTGIKGLDISPDKGKVIVYEKKKKGCCGKCRDYKCHDHDKH